MINSVNNRLKSLRTGKGLTVSEMAEIIGVSRISVGNWERGDKQPRINNLKKYANYFNIPVGWIIYGDFEQYLYNVITNEVSKGTELTKTAVDFFDRNYIYDKEINQHKDFESADSYDFEYNGFSPDYIHLSSGICDFFLFGYDSSNISHFVHDDKGSFFTEYDEFMKEIGYNDEVIIFNTIDLFKKDLKPLEEIFILKDDIKVDRGQLLQLGIDEKTVNEIYPAVDEKDFYNISQPNILKIENALLKYKKDKKDVPDSIADAVIKLLN